MGNPAQLGEVSQEDEAWKLQVSEHAFPPDDIGLSMYTSLLAAVTCMYGASGTAC